MNRIFILTASIQLLLIGCGTDETVNERMAVASVEKVTYSK
jgi:hypothetical protein